MKSVYDFIIEPLGETYNNKKNVAGKELVLNTKIENYKFINNVAKVLETPLAYDTPINKGDLILIHHNVFRTFYDVKGIKKKSRSYFKDDSYFCALEQIYLYNPGDKWRSVNDRCFIKPLESKDSLRTDKEQKLVGILKIGNSSLEELGINEGDCVGYTPYGEYDFVVNEERLYCMKSNDIVIKYGSKENQTEYNPSWANSG